MFCTLGFNFFKQELSQSDFNYLEIGVFNGDSIAELGKAYPNKSIFGIDPFIEDGNTTHITKIKENHQLSVQKQNTYNNIFGLNNVKLFEEKSIDFYNQLTDEMIEEMNVAWVLIDGSHHYADVIVDIKLAMKLIGDKRGGVVFDDCCNVADVNRAHQECVDNYNQLGPPMDLSSNSIAHTVNY